MSREWIVEGYRYGTLDAPQREIDPDLIMDVGRYGQILYAQIMKWREQGGYFQAKDILALPDADIEKERAKAIKEVIIRMFTGE